MLLTWLSSHACTIFSSFTLYYPRDPINDLCSLTGKRIPEIYFTYRSVQNLKPCSGDFMFHWSSAQDCAVRCLLLNPVVLLISAWQKSVRRKWFVLAVYQFWKGISAGLALKYFTWFIGAGGYSHVLYCAESCRCRYITLMSWCPWLNSLPYVMLCWVMYVSLYDAGVLVPMTQLSLSCDILRWVM